MCHDRAPGNGSFCGRGCVASMRPVIVRLPAALTFIQEPIRAQRRASNTGVIMVAGQRFALGWVHKYQIVTVLVSQTTLAIGLDDQRPVSYAVLPLSPVRSIKGQRPQGSGPVSYT